MPDLLNRRDGDLSRSEAWLQPLRFEDLNGFGDFDVRPAWQAFRHSCRALAEQHPQLRPGCAPNEQLVAICNHALGLSEDATPDQIRAFLERRFVPRLIVPSPAEPGNATTGGGQTFFTAYYRPEVPASRECTPAFREPLLARPDDLVSLHIEGSTDLPPGFSAGRPIENGRLETYPSREQIEAGALGERGRPLAYVKDAIEAFMIQVQGSARLIFEDGSAADLTYAGRNGHPYVSIGRALIEAGEISPQDMSLDRLKAWVRAHGQGNGEEGRKLLQRNPSFVFFSIAPATGKTGPVGAAGVPLLDYASLAVDRTLWPYGLPFWIEAEIPWRGAAVEPFRQLMIAQDTGSAIVGAARADLYFGSGDQAGRLAGGIRHGGRMIVLVPRSST